MNLSQLLSVENTWPSAKWWKVAPNTQIYLLSLDHNKRKEHKNKYVKSSTIGLNFYEESITYFASVHTDTFLMHCWWCCKSLLNYKVNVGSSGLSLEEKNRIQTCHGKVELGTYEINNTQHISNITKLWRMINWLVLMKILCSIR